MRKELYDKEEKEIRAKYIELWGDEPDHLNWYFAIMFNHYQSLANDILQFDAQGKDYNSLREFVQEIQSKAKELLEPYDN